MYRYRCLPILSFVTFFGGRNRLHTRNNSKSAFTTSAVRAASDEARIRRFPDDEEDEKRAALLAGLEDDDDDGDLHPEREYNEDNSSQGNNSGHHYNKLVSGRESVESYETTSSGHTVRYTTATDFSTSYRPQYFGHHDKRGYHGRKSESMNYLSGSIIVNALMWPLANGQRNSTNSLPDSQSQSQPSSHTNSRDRLSGEHTDSIGDVDGNDADTLSNTLHNTH